MIMLRTSFKTFSFGLIALARLVVPARAEVVLSNLTEISLGLTIQIRAFFLRPACAALLGFAAMTASNPAAADMSWNWSYSGAGISASGTFITNNTPDSSGFYQITAITGQRNGVTITGLQLAGTAIPGNEPYTVDNLFSLDSPKLTGEGFGFGLADGTFANPFFASFDSPPDYLEFYSAPPFTGGTGSEDSELPISFTVTAGPEPSTYAMALAGLACGGYLVRRRRKRA